jgi:hypothetical protein
MVPKTTGAKRRPYRSLTFTERRRHVTATGAEGTSEFSAPKIVVAQ